VRWRAVKFLPNFLHDALDVPHHVIVPESNDAIAVARKFSGAQSILIPLVGVLAAIQLDRQL